MNGLIFFLRNQEIFFKKKKLKDLQEILFKLRYLQKIFLELRNLQNIIFDLRDLHHLRGFLQKEDISTLLWF